MNNIQIGKIMKTGTSISLVIPVNILKAYNIKRGDKVAFRCLEDSNFQVWPIPDRIAKEIFLPTIKA